MFPYLLLLPPRWSLCQVLLTGAERTDSCRLLYWHCGVVFNIRDVTGTTWMPAIVTAGFSSLKANLEINETMEQCLWEANSSGSDCQDCPPFMKPKGPPPCLQDRTARSYPVYNHRPYLYLIYFNIILPSAPRYPKVFSLQGLTRIFNALFASQTCCMFHPSHSPDLITLVPVIFQHSCHLISLWTKYSPRHFVQCLKGTDQSSSVRTKCKAVPLRRASAKRVRKYRS
jgi:hypothetical protein